MVCSDIAPPDLCVHLVFYALGVILYVTRPSFESCFHLNCSITLLALLIVSHQFCGVNLVHYIGLVTSTHRFQVEPLILLKDVYIRSLNRLRVNAKLKLECIV